MSEVSVQVYEEGALSRLRPVRQEGCASASRVSTPVNVINCVSVAEVASFKELGGVWTHVVARPGTPSARREYEVRVGPVPVRGAQVKVFKGLDVVASAATGSDGRAVIDLPVKAPAHATLVATVAPAPLGQVRTPLQDVFRLSVWLLTCEVRNVSDRWWRFVGRSFDTPLPRIFWKEAPPTVIGLAAPWGTQRFVDVVPAFSDLEMRVEYGVSAVCNTVSPAPPPQECLEARKHTWWEFKVTAWNGKDKHAVTSRLNLDRHLRLKITADKVVGEVVKPAGAET